VAGSGRCANRDKTSRVPQAGNLIVLARYPAVMKHSVILTTPTAEIPALSDEERFERRRRFIERVFSPDGLDRATLEHIEQLTGEER
jgi:hypothetical protein